MTDRPIQNDVASPPDSRERRRLKHNFAYIGLDGMVWTLGMSFMAVETVVPVFLDRLGASKTLIALPNCLMTIGFAFAPLLMAHRIQSLRWKKPYVLLWGGAQRIVWIVPGLACLFWGEAHPGLVLFLSLFAIGISYYVGGMAFPAWFEIVAKAIPVRLRGRIFSIRQTGGMLLGVFGALAVTRILASTSFPHNFAALFLIGSAFLMGSLFLISRIDEPDTLSVAPPGNLAATLRRVPAILYGNRNFAHFLAARGFFILAFASSPFLAIHARSRFDLPESYVGIFTMIGYVTSLLVTPLLGWLADRFGHKLNFLIAGSCATVVAATALWSGRLAVYLSVFAFMMIANSARMVSQQTMTIEFCRPEERPVYIAMSGLLVLPAAFLSLGMGYVAERWGYAYLFGIAEISAILGTAWFLFKVREPRRETIPPEIVDK
ncbi:MAG: MFS transporter [Planctomycetota bacterium]